MTEQRIRILIADDSALQRAHLTQLIAEQQDMQVVANASSGQDAVRRASELQPDVVLMDIHMPDMDGIQATWLVSSQVPNGAVIMVTSEERIDFLQKAMSAGAQGYVLKPFGNGESLLQTVRETHQRLQGRRVTTVTKAPPPVSLALGKRIAVLGTKGGVGSTTVAANLALSLRRQTQRSVLLFDADLQYGDAGIHLGMAGEHSVIDLLPHIDALDSSTIESAVAKHGSGVGLLDRPNRPELVDTVSSDHMRSVLSALARSYEWVVTDTARFYDERALASLDVADVQVIVMTATLGALRNVHQYLGLAERLGYSRERMIFVLNRANSTGGLTFDDVAGVVGTRQILKLPSVGAQLTESINDGRPTLGAQFQQAFDPLVAKVREMAAAVAPDAR
ncbi:MAG: response regulator [Chloroflexi bacterium]|nr:response regulator [Chloroflexota bacterium]MBV9895875.1 response regulator [Chloroflexota bacterium]